MSCSTRCGPTPVPKRLPSASAFGYHGRLPAARGTATMTKTPPARLIGMSGSLRAGSYSNAVLETLREKFAGTAELAIWDLAPIPPYNQDFEGEKRPAPVKAHARRDRRGRRARAVRARIQPQHSRRVEERARLGVAAGFRLGHGVQAGGDHGDLARRARRRPLPRAHAGGAQFDDGAGGAWRARSSSPRPPTRSATAGWSTRPRLGFACGGGRGAAAARSGLRAPTSAAGD